MLGSGEATKIEVTFHKGAGSSNVSSFVETVDLIPVDALKQVIRVALEPEDLRKLTSIEGRN